MTLKQFFDLKMILLLVTMVILLVIMVTLSPLGSLDTRFFYSDIEATIYLQMLSGEMLRNYLFVECLDLFFIYKYSRALLLALQRLYPDQKIGIVALLPGAFDLVETLSVIGAIHSETHLFPIGGMGYFTSLKWISAGAVVVFVFGSLFQKLRKN